MSGYCGAHLILDEGKPVCLAELCDEIALAVTLVRVVGTRIVM